MKIRSLIRDFKAVVNPELDAIEERIRQRWMDRQEQAVKDLITGACEQCDLDVVAIVPVEAGVEILATCGPERWSLRLALTMSGEYLCSAAGRRPATDLSAYSDCFAAGSAASPTIEGAITAAVDKALAGKERK